MQRIIERMPKSKEEWEFFCDETLYPIRERQWAGFLFHYFSLFKPHQNITKQATTMSHFEKG